MASHLSHLQVAARILHDLPRTERLPVVKLALYLTTARTQLPTVVAAVRTAFASAWEDLAGRRVPMQRLAFYFVSLSPHGFGRHLGLVRNAATEEDLVVVLEELLRALHHAMAATLILPNTAPIARPKHPSEVHELRRLILAGIQFGTVYGDLPWHYHHESDNPHLPLVSEAFKQLPIRRLAAKSAVCLLWVPVPIVPLALDVLDGWGFAYCGTTVWTNGTLQPFDGSQNPDVVLICGARNRASFPGAHFAARRGNRRTSANAHAILRLVETTCPPRYLHLFARADAGRPLWTAWNPPLDSPDDFRGGS